MSHRLCCSSQEHVNKSDVVFYAVDERNMTAITQVHTRRTVFDYRLVQIPFSAKSSVYKSTLGVVNTVNPIIRNFLQQSSRGIEQVQCVPITTRRNLDGRCISQRTQLCFRFLCCIYSLSKQRTSLILRS